MDKSKEFINMCLQSNDIQSMRIVDEKFQIGDFYASGINKENPNIMCANINTLRFDFDIWLPRIDQLIDMVQHYTKTDSRSLINYLDSASYGIKIPNEDYNPFKTLDRFLLAFVLKEKFCKGWSDKNKTWVSLVDIEKSDVVTTFDEKLKCWIEKDIEC